MFRKILAKGLVILLLASWTSVFGGSLLVVAAGATIYVDDDNTGGPWDGTLAHPYRYIQDGINAASDGDIVHVFGGTYVENVVADKSITLTGESKPVINGTTGHGIDVFANNVTIEGFNITYSGYCIYTNASGFSILNNVFWHDFDYDFYGVYWYISESSLTEDYIVHASRIEDNDFYMSGMYKGISVDIELDYGSNSGYDVEIGDIQICNNRFYMEGSTATGIDIDYIYVEYLYGGTVSFGVLNMSGNTMYGGYYGIDFYGYLDDLQDVQASVDDVIINDNVLVDQESDSIYVDYYDGSYYYGNTVVTYGDLVIGGNTIVHSADGIYVSNIGYWGELYDYARIEVGNVSIEENEIDVGGYGIIFYGYGVCHYIDDNSSFTMGNISVRNNTIASGSDGIYVYLDEFGYYMYGNSSFTMGSIKFNNNAINSSRYGIYVDSIRMFGEYIGDNSSFTMGNIEFSDNIIKSGDDGIYVNELGGDIGNSLEGTSSFTMGDIQFNGNQIDSGECGIYIFHMEYFGYNMKGTSSFAMGNIELSGNIIDSGWEGIFIYDISEFGCDMYDNSSFAMGSILVNNNIIINSGTGAVGVYVDYFTHFGEYMHGASSFTMGNIEFSGNEIVSVDNGIRIGEISYFGSNTNNNAMFAMGDVLLNDNTIRSGWYGIIVYNMLQFGWEMHGNSSVSMGNIEFCRNTINSTVDALGFGNFYRFGYFMYDDSSFSMGSVLVNDNTLYSYIWLTNFGYFGSIMYGNASFTMNNVEFYRNMIHSIGRAEDGITFYNLLPFGHEMFGNSSFAMGDFYVSSNTIVGDGDRFGIAVTQGSGGFGINIHDNASAMMGNYEFASNNISFARLGFNLWMVKNAIIRSNTIRNSTEIGIFLPESAGNRIYHNNFINNTVQAYVTPNYNNTWDNGYPSGGNYWSDYTGTDQYSGPDQDVPGSDFRGDTSHIINQNNTDHYPLTIPYETIPPSIVILSPENTTYSVDIIVQLTFTLDEPVDWMGYSLDGQASVTITGNMTLSTLTVGGHRVSVYGNDTFNNMGVSTVYLTVSDFTDPVADAGSDRTLNEDVLVTLDGSGSTDNVGITSYTWTFTDETVKTLTGDKPTYTFNNPGVFTITLNVTDAAGNWAIDTVVITVSDITDPIANAGQDQTANVGETVSFDAGSSTDNVGIVSYEWDFGDETSATGITATHEYADAGTYTVTLTVKDAAGNQATNTVVVTVNPAEAFPWWIAAVGIITVSIAIALMMLRRRRKKA